MLFPDNLKIPLAAASVAAVVLVNFMSNLSQLVTGVFLICLLMLMTLDMLTAFVANAQYDWKTLIKDKYFALILIVMSFIMDVVIYASVNFLPADFIILEQGFPFVTLASLTWFIGAEVFMIVGRYSDRGVQSGMKPPPHLAIFATQIQGIFRRVDAERWKLSHHDGSLPPERWPDKLYKEGKLEEVLEFIARVEREEGRTPADPEAELDEITRE
jgi:hypothetical protein